MIKKKSDYDQTSGFGQSDFKPLKKGGYICRILSAEETKSKSGKDMLHIYFDICEGDFTDHFNDLYKARKKANTDPLRKIEWPFEGQKWIMVDDYENPSKTSRQFKGFCSAVEDSGTEIWGLDGNLDLNRLKGAKVGIVFQNVEKEYNGNTSWRAEPWAFRSIESIATGDYFIPEDKELPATYGTGFAETNDTFDSQLSDLPF